MSEMFKHAFSFNQDIGIWDVGNVKDMSFMFAGATGISRTIFNQDISKWNVSEVVDMTNMFSNSKFDQDISSWEIVNITDMNNFLKLSKLTTSFYNNLLIEWTKDTLMPDVVFSAGMSKYSAGEASEARQFLIDSLWVISDGGQSDLPVVVTDTVRDLDGSLAVSESKVLLSGVSMVTGRGIVWDTVPYPTTEMNLGAISDSSGLGEFMSTLTGLDPGKAYYVGSYASNDSGTEYGNTILFDALVQLSIGGSFEIEDKIYDRSKKAVASANNLILQNTVQSFSNVTLTNVTFAFADSTVGNEIFVIIAGAELGGTDMDKYTLSLQNTPTSRARITPKELTVSDVTVLNKVYDGTTDAILSNATLMQL